MLSLRTKFPVLQVTLLHRFTLEATSVGGRQAQSSCSDMCALSKSESIHMALQHSCRQLVKGDPRCQIVICGRVLRCCCERGALLHHSPTVLKAQNVNMGTYSHLNSESGLSPLV